MQDYANKTVTFELNPHQPAAGLHASIHPCRHAETMKRIIDHVTAGGQEPRVDQYLFIFLKCVLRGSHVVGQQLPCLSPARLCVPIGAGWSRVCPPPACSPATVSPGSSSQSFRP